MHNSKVKKILAFALALTMLMPLGSVFAADQTEEDADSQAADSGETEDEEEEEEEEEAVDETIDLQHETTVSYVQANMSVLNAQGDYTIYKGIIREKRNLQTLIESSEYVIAEDYTEESYGAYSQALAAAKAADANENSTQDELDEAYINLDRAASALVMAGMEETPFEEPETVDKTTLQTALDGQDTELVAEDYTNYTWNLYQQALADARTVNSDPNATQAEVNEAAENISYTYGKLIEAPDEILAVVYNHPEDGYKLVGTMDMIESEDGSDVVNTTPNGIWVVETDADHTRVTNFYIRLLSNFVENAYVTTAKTEIYYMDVNSGEVSATYTYESEDAENGRLFVSSDGRMAYTNLETDRLLADIELVCENDNMALYADSTNKKIAVYDKTADKYWWTTPVDPYGDETIIDKTKNSVMKLPQRNQAASGLILKYGDLRQEKRNETYVYSSVVQESGRGSEKWELNQNGVTITYEFNIGFTVPVTYTLNDDYIEVAVNISEIDEENTSTVDGKVITALALSPTFGASPYTDLAGNEVEGYMVVPDGSGAVIEYNNDKEGYTSYSQTLYGRDKTTVPLNAPRVTEQAYLPLIATVSGNSGLVAIATEGDENAAVKAQVSRQNRQSFNNVYFEFNLRSSDTYYMGGTDGTRITVFEKGDIKTDRISVRYYPISDEQEVNYADVAEVYRNYLINEEGLEKKTEAGNTDLYLDLYGGVLKETSVFGIPVDMKTEITTFDQAEEIMKKLSDGGVTGMIATYNDWTNKSMVGKISTSFSPSGKLGGSSGFEDLQSAAESMNAEIYPTLSNMEMVKNSWGYMTINKTATRVSNAQSRQSEYSTAFGVQLSGKAPALLTPNAYSKVFDQIISSFTKKGQTNVGFGDYANTLVSDFSTRNAKSRSSTEATIIEGYKKASEEVGNIIADEANSYVIPYADHITNVPVYSSQYNVVDYDIPLYQMVIHGYVPYASTAINANSNAEEVFLLSLASGSAIHYDFIYENAFELLDTDYDDLYYANYNGWLDAAIEQYKVSDEILSQVSDMIITDYQIDTETGVITTTYNDSVVITVDTQNATADVNGQTYDLSSIVSEGGLQG